MSDDQFGRAGQELDRMSREHTPAGHDSNQRRVWLTVAAAAVVITAVVTVAVVGRRTRNSSSIVSATSTSTVPGTNATSTSGATTTTVAAADDRCVGAQSEPVQGAILFATLEMTRSCGGEVRLLVENNSATTCTSDQNATFSQQRMHFVSQSGMGGAKGYWEPAPTGAVDSTGVIEYPPGKSAWPISIPRTEDPFGDELVIDATCDGRASQVRVRILTAPNFPHSLGSTAVTGTYDNVKYYNPCGDAPFDFRGTTLYPLLPGQAAALDPGNYAKPTAPSTTATKHSLLRPAVPAPGPGDDVGTMMLYSDGIARFESKTGKVSWFTTAPQTYSWVC